MYICIQNNSNIKEFWHSINKLLLCSSPSLLGSPSKHSADQFLFFFADKFKTLRSKFLLINLNPLFLPDHSPPIFLSFKPAFVSKIKQLVQSSPKSTCLLDPILSCFLPHCIDSITPIIASIVNLSLSSDVFPKHFKSAFANNFLKNFSSD